MSRLTPWFLLALALTVSGCSTLQKKPRYADSELVWVGRPDGTMSCDPRQAEDLGSVGESLRDADADVVESMRWHDDSIQPDQCRQPTGWKNAYRIPRTALDKAQELGFQELKLPDIQGLKAKVVK